ncbi:MAG: CotH kinase family protein [Lachnospiraceae bacterium]|nr:CotH kinase family protein [Lachnospiraceae bacterium]
MRLQSKRIYVVIIVLIVVTAAGADRIRRTGPAQRYLQHQEKLPAGEPPAGEFATHLPILTIQAKEDIPGEYRAEGGVPEAYAVCRVAVYQEENQWNTLLADAVVEEEARIRIRGNSSRWFDKKSYLLKFGTAQEKIKVSVMGMNPSDKWVLYGPFLDRTLLRNYLCYSVAGQIMEYAPQARYCELFLNGEYQGLYLVVEAVSVEEGRLALRKTGAKNPVSSWLVRWDRDSKSDNRLDNFVYYTYQGGVSSLDLLYPGQDTCTPEKKAFIESEISAIERALYMQGGGRSEYAAHIDVTAFAQYFVINEFFENIDAGRFSTYYYKDVRGKVKPVVWDFNNGNDNYIHFETDGGGFSMVQSPWIGEMIKDRQFVEEVIFQYTTLRKELLSDAYLDQLIDDTAAYLGDAVSRNYEKYGYVFSLQNVDSYNYLFPVERNYTSYEEAVQQLKDQIHLRGRWLDRNIETLLQYCSDSRNALEATY